MGGRRNQGMLRDLGAMLQERTERKPAKSHSNRSRLVPLFFLSFFSFFFFLCQKLTCTFHKGVHRTLARRGSEGERWIGRGGGGGVEGVTGGGVEEAGEHQR